MENFFDYINDWLNSGIYTFFTEFTAYVIEAAVVGYLSFLNFVIPFAWGVAKTILDDLNVSSQINAAFNDLDSMSQALLVAFRIPECINFALSALATKFVLRMLPGV